MNLPFSFTAPAKLYAFLLKLRPLQPGTLMAFSGELVHGAWMHSLGEVAPDVAKWLHNDNKKHGRRAPCSSTHLAMRPPLSSCSPNCMDASVTSHP